MRSLYKYFAFFFLALTSAGMINAQNPDLPKFEILGKDYYEYTAKKGESLFSIARQYGWDYNILQNLNPRAVSPLNKGFKIYYPVPETIKGMLSDSNNPDMEVTEVTAPEIYTIKRGDTLYSLAKRFNTTVAAIMRLNPGVSESNFKADAKIKIPVSGTGIKKIETTIEQERLNSFETYKVEKNDSWESIASKKGVSAEELKDINKGVGSKLKNKSVITIPVIDTVEIDTLIIDEDPRETILGGIKEIYDDVHGINDTISLSGPKITLLLSDPSTKKDLEFTRGILAGLEKLKSSGISIDFNVMDINWNSTDVLTELAEMKPDLILLTTEKGIPTYLSEFAEISQTPMINTFDVRNDMYEKNPYIIQLLTPSDIMNETITSRIKDAYGEYTLIFLGDSDPSDAIAQDLTSGWPSGKVKKLSVDGLKHANFKPDGKFLFYGYPQKKDDVKELLGVVGNIKEKYPLADILTLGRPSWIVYDELLGSAYHTANVVIPSRFYYDENNGNSSSFINNYNLLFNRTPAESYPMYAAMGYDCILYFAPELVVSGGDLNEFHNYKDGVQNEFELFRPANWTGLVNPVVYLVRFTPYNTVEKIVLR